MWCNLGDHAQGICKYLVEVFGEDEAKRRGVALGYDHRAQGSLSSRRFAELAAAACLHAGFKVFLYRGVVATPMVVRLRFSRGCTLRVMEARLTCLVNMATH